MSPPPPLTALSAASRFGGAVLVCGGCLPLLSLALDRGRAQANASASTYMAVLCLSVLALAYIGSLRASITHQARGRLAAQTALIALPCVVFAKIAGAVLATPAPV